MEMCPRCPWSGSNTDQLLDHVQRTHLHQVEKFSALTLARESNNLSKAGPRHVAEERVDELADIALEQLRGAVKPLVKGKPASATDNLQVKFSEILKWYGDSLLAITGTLAGGERSKPSDRGYLSVKANLTNLA